MLKKISTLILVLSLFAFNLIGCAPAPTPPAGDGQAPAQQAPDAGGTDPGDALVGVSMPTQALQRWNQDGTNMRSILEEKGYKVDLQYANNDVNTQVQQLENMITKGCNILVIAAIDGAALTDVLATAERNNVQVIAYDRLIMQSPNVSYYATFDNFQVGVIQGKYIEEQLDLQNATGPFNMEIFAGSPDDNNATFFFNGAMSILNRYIEEGKLVVPSGQTDFNTVAIQGWDSGRAQARMDTLITANYAQGQMLDVVLSPNDSLALGVISSLKNAGYGQGDRDFPIITGQDCDKPNVIAMINGEQSMSIFKDTRTLASRVADMVDAILQGEEAPVNDTETYNNGVMVVPSYLVEPVYADRNNYREILIETGYYTEAELQ